MILRLSVFASFLTLSACSPPSSGSSYTPSTASTTASSAQQTVSPPPQARNSGTCPAGAKQQVAKATASGLYRTEIDAGGGQIFISRATADTIGFEGLEILALNLDCAAAGGDGVLKSVMIRTAPGEKPMASFSASELLEFRRKHEQLGLR